MSLNPIWSLCSPLDCEPGLGCNNQNMKNVNHKPQTIKTQKLKNPEPEEPFNF